MDCCETGSSRNVDQTSKPIPKAVIKGEKDMFAITSEMLDERIEALINSLGSLYAGGEALKEEFYESV